MWDNPNACRFPQSLSAIAVCAVEHGGTGRLGCPVAVDVGIRAWWWSGRGAWPPRSRWIWGSLIAARAMVSVARSILRGRPPMKPRARAAARPAWVHSAISSLSNSANIAKRPKASRPLAVVSICAPAPARTFRPTSRTRRFPAIPTKWLRSRPSRSSRHSTSVLPDCSASSRQPDLARRRAGRRQNPRRCAPARLQRRARHRAAGRASGCCRFWKPGCGR